MLVSRLFKPKKRSVAYHYCSAATLLAILGTSTLRFSDINMMNDAQEFRLGYSTFEEAATRIVKRMGLKDTAPEIPISFFDEVDKFLSVTQLVAHPFLACFSLDGDSLEQWRAYGDDGRGFAIGFDAAALKQLPCTLLKVQYDREKQVKEMMVALMSIYVSSYPKRLADPGSFRSDCFLLGVYLAGLKHASFKSEKEVRCLHVLHLEKAADGSRRFVDGGGVRAGVEVPGEKVAFQARDGHLCAYFDMPFGGTADTDPVVEIVLGPKNPSNPGNIYLYLAGAEHQRVRVRASTLPYR